MSARVSPILMPDGNNFLHANGKARPDVAAYFSQVTQNRQHSRREQRASMSYDSARVGTDLDGHWLHADGLDADSANNPLVRSRLRNRSRYETGSNGYYAGALLQHANFLTGATGPKLRMLTKNRAFNQFVESEFAAWQEMTEFNRKLRCMAFARFGDGETFAILQTNPKFEDRRVALDLLVIEAEQCQTPFLPIDEQGYIDGIRYDEHGNVLWYDVLRVHPGSNSFAVNYEAERVPANQMLHWFKLQRAGAHRGKPDMTPTLNVGASSRRFREATVAAAETAADLAAVSTTTHSPSGDSEPDPIAPFTGIPMPKRTWMFNPMGWDVHQMKAEHPNATYSEFTRQQISEQSRPLGQPFNLTAGDSSTYSFASGKLDTLGYFLTLDIERSDCDLLVLDRIFEAWFREWDVAEDVRQTVPLHQWDWPSHPIIDEVSHENAKEIRLKNGTSSLRQEYSDDGKDFEDELAVMAEDMFGEATEENITKARQIIVLKSTGKDALPYVAQVLGVSLATTQGVPVNA